MPPGRRSFRVHLKIADASGYIAYASTVQAMRAHGALVLHVDDRCLTISCSGSYDLERSVVSHRSALVGPRTEAAGQKRDGQNFMIAKGEARWQWHSGTMSVLELRVLVMP